MLSEDVNIKLGEYGYDFNSKDKIIIVKDKPENNNSVIINKKHSLNKNIINDETKEDKLENDIILVKNEEETPIKKYQIKNLGNNNMNLPENYSTDDEDEFKFINLMNETNESYELAVDSKNVKTYSKIVSHIKFKFL